jgi:hypothetical protein
MASTLHATFESFVYAAPVLRRRTVDATTPASLHGRSGP